MCVCVCVCTYGYHFELGLGIDIGKKGARIEKLDLWSWLVGGVCIWEWDCQGRLDGYGYFMLLSCGIFGVWV